MFCLSRLVQGSSKSKSGVSDAMASSNLVRCFMPEENSLNNLFLCASRPDSVMIEEILNAGRRFLKRK